MSDLSKGTEELRYQLLSLKDDQGQHVIGSLIGGDPSKLHTLTKFINAHTAKQVAAAEKAMAERCWAEVHPAKRGWHRVGDIYDAAVAKLTSLTHTEEKPE